MSYILATDDDLEVLGTLMRALHRQGYEVTQARDGRECLDAIAKRIPDLLILDIMMPGIDGLTVCRQLRASARYADMPILFLTAKGSTDEVVAGLDAGGDDYVTKPFELAELNARVRALLRRSQHDQGPEYQPVIAIGRLSLDSGTYRVTVDGERVVQLTATEHRLLRYLMESADQAVPPQRLLQEVWDYPPDTGDPDLVRAHVRNLRAKVESNANNPIIIRTIHGVGYMVSSRDA
jgi:DNA-binding response OmpR family regulator